MAENETPRKKFPYPNKGQLVTAGAADLQELAEAFDHLDEVHGEFMSPGVTDLETFKAFGESPTINAANGTATLPKAAGGTSWHESPGAPVGDMTRCIVARQAWSVKPSALPAAGKFSAVAWKITPEGETRWGKPAVAEAVTYGEFATQAAAEEAALPAGSSGTSITVGSFIITNTAGSYFLAGQANYQATLAQPLGGASGSASYAEFTRFAVARTLAFNQLYYVGSLKVGEGVGVGAQHGFLVLTVTNPEREASVTFEVEVGTKGVAELGTFAKFKLGLGSAYEGADVQCIGIPAFAEETAFKVTKVGGTANQKLEAALLPV